MKKASIYILSTLFLAAGISACGKTTKGKMSNEWKVTSMESKETYENSTGDKFVSTFSTTESTVTEVDEDYPAFGAPSTETKTGVMNTNEFIINKDGTWSWLIDATYPTADGTHQEIVEETGTWSFLDRTKGDDFKKNERVLFNVLTAHLRDIVIENGVVVDDYTDDLVYTTGKSTMIYTVITSKKDQLELEMDAKNVSTQNPNTNPLMNANSTHRNMVLEAK
ncbi:MAG: hypothetical protein ACO1N0_16380 [Fluviicola sp.]